MKQRRTIDASKLRRPVKKSRITDSVNGSWLLYARFFAVWLLVVTMDFILEFRFEFLWPFWLLIRSCYDSFRYQGLGLTVLFLSLTVVSDLLFLFFLPMQWLFFVASTYVWVQYVCSSDKGLCLPTISLWLLFVYVEASVRLKEIKGIPFNLDLCRPFAAHCIGYPAISLCCGIKSYVGYKIKHIKQTTVSNENDFYIRLVSHALPPELHKNEKDDYANLHQRKNIAPASSSSREQHQQQNQKEQPQPNQQNTKSGDIEGLLASEARRRGFKLSDIKAEIEEKQNGTGSLSLSDLELITNIPVKELAKKNGLHFDGDSSFVKVSNGRVQKLTNNSSGISSDKNNQQGTTVNSSSSKIGSDDDGSISDSEESTHSNHRVTNHDSSPKNKLNRSGTHLSSNHAPKDHGGSNSNQADNTSNKLKEEAVQRKRAEQQAHNLDSECKKLRSEVTSLRQTEADLRTQINLTLVTERYIKVELTQLRSENEELQQKVNTYTNSKSSERSFITSLEKKLRMERDQRASFEQQLKELKQRQEKQKSVREESSPIRAPLENHEHCVHQRQELEQDSSKLQTSLDEMRARCDSLERENAEMQKAKKQADTNKMKKDVELLTGALTAMQGKNIHLENNLSSETRLKLDLFSALGETRRQLELCQQQLGMKDKELDTMKLKVAEVMAVMSPQGFSNAQITPNSSTTYQTSVSTSYIPASTAVESLRTSYSPSSSIHHNISSQNHFTIAPMPPHSQSSLMTACEPQGSTGSSTMNVQEKIENLSEK